MDDKQIMDMVLNGVFAALPDAFNVLSNTYWNARYPIGLLIGFTVLTKVFSNWIDRPKKRNSRKRIR